MENKADEVLSPEAMVLLRNRIIWYARMVLEEGTFGGPDHQTSLNLPYSLAIQHIRQTRLRMSSVCVRKELVCKLKNSSQDICSPCRNSRNFVRQSTLSLHSTYQRLYTLALLSSAFAFCSQCNLVYFFENSYWSINPSFFATTPYCDIIIQGCSA